MTHNPMVYREFEPQKHIPILHAFINSLTYFEQLGYLYNADMFDTPK